MLLSFIGGFVVILILLILASIVIIFGLLFILNILIYIDSLHITRVNDKELFSFVGFGDDFNWCIADDLILEKFLFLLLLQLLKSPWSQLILG